MAGGKSIARKGGREPVLPFCFKGAFEAFPLSSSAQVVISSSDNAHLSLSLTVLRPMVRNVGGPPVSRARGL